jgi:hypothetical protein
MAIADSIRAKITRAEQHIQDFYIAVKAFNKSQPHGIEVKEDPKARERIYYVTKVIDVPEGIAAIAVDALQNLRSPLDQITYQLEVLGLGGAEPKQRVYFPIANSASEYKSLRNGCIKAMRQDAIDAIDATEPYKGGKGHAFWQLNTLNKFDKHKLLEACDWYFAGFDIAVDMKRFVTDLTGVSASEDARAKLADSIPQILLQPKNPLLKLKVGDELFREPIERKMDENRKFIFDISFNKPGVIECEPAIKTLKDMSDLVGNTVERLIKFL